MPSSFIKAVLNDRMRGWRLFFFPSGGTFPGILIPFRDGDDDHDGRCPDRDDWEDPPDRRRKNGSRPTNGNRP